MEEPRIAGWDRRVDMPLTVLAVLFLAAYAWQVLDTSLSTSAATALEAAIWVIWALFALGATSAGICWTC